MQNFNTSKYINVIGNKAHMIVKSRIGNGFAIYHTDRQYVIFNISCGNRLKIKTCKTLKTVKKYIEQNGINIPDKRNIEIKYPTTWTKVKIGQLKWTIDRYDESDRYLDRLLLQLI